MMLVRFNRTTQSINQYHQLINIGDSRQKEKICKRVLYTMGLGVRFVTRVRGVFMALASSWR